MQGRSGIPGGAGSGHGVLALLVVRPEAREVPAEQRPAHHTQPTLLPLPGVSLCSPAGGQTAGEMWPVSVVRERQRELFASVLVSRHSETPSDSDFAIFLLQPAEPVLCKEPGLCAEAGRRHTGLQ